MDMPSIPVVAAVGDTVQARISDEHDENPTVTSFVLTGIDGTVFEGAPLVPLGGSVDTADGWEVEVITKGDPDLPTDLSFIAAIFTFDRVTALKLIGAGTSWQIDGGGRVDAREIVGWMPWSQWEPLATEYLHWQAEQNIAAMAALAVDPVSTEL